MALIKEKMTKLKIAASYWKVGMMTIDTNHKEASFSLNLYFTNDSSDVDSYVEVFSVSDMMGNEDKTLYEKYFGKGSVNYPNWQTACYMYAKENIEFFKDAVSDVEVTV